MPDPTVHLLQQSVAMQFLTRPTLRSVAAQMLSDNLQEQYPPLTQSVLSLRLAQPRDGGGRALLPLLEVALAHLADGSYPDVSTRDGKDCYLSDATGNRLTYQPYKDEPARAYDLKVIESVIHELPQVLFIAFQGALAAYWGQDSDAGVSRWKWLATVLHNQLRRSSVQYSAASARQLQILKALTTYPDRQTRASQPSPDNTVYAYTLETQLRRNEATLTMSSADLLIISGTDVLLCRTSGQIESFTSVDAFGEAWCKRTQQRFYADSITWRQYEPDGNIFEVQAALILNQQLEELAAIKLPGSSRIDVLETLFATITNPSLSLGAEAFVPQPHIQAVLPYWLKNAAPSDRFAYRQYLLEQALLTRTTFNDTDLDQLDSIDAYASSHLDHQLCLDRNNHLYGERRCSEDAATQPYKALELELTFHVAVGGLEGGYIEPVSMNLVELALKNLSGRPKGRMTIRHTGGQEIEAWLTPDYIFQLVQRVDIGLNYPNYIREKLLSDTPAVKKRQRLYIQQRPLQLNIQALEHKIRGEAGFTHRGIRLVAAAFKPCASERWVDDDEIVLRPLAFVRKPGATADVVQNMFIIEPKNPRVGPHLLYHPAGRQSMREFTDRASLLAAIVQPGELQDSVLAWLTDSARPVYSNGGFIEPHYVRIGIGSEFDILPSKPSPATLADADDESSNEILQAQRNNTLMAYLFNCDAHQLVDQAERDSTSNTESRWALIVEGLQLGFNTLLMAVRGPIAAVGWMLQLMGALKNDLPELESDDPTARELAWIDLLMNISMLLLHSRTPNDTTAQPRPLDERTEQLRVRLPFRRSLSATGPLPRAVITRGTIGLPSEPPGGGHTVLDFDRSLATDSAAARLLEKLSLYKVHWPNPMPLELTFGNYKGLYRIDGRLHASVAGLLFRVSIVPGFGEVYIIHPDKPDHPGILLKTDGKGRWTLDRGLKLSGGGRKRLAELREQNREKKQELIAATASLAVEIQDNLDPPVRQSMTQVTTWRQNLKTQRRTLSLVWDLLQRATVDQRPALEARQQTEMQNYERVRRSYRMLLDTLIDQSAKLLASRQQLIDLGRELKDVAGAGAHVQDMEKTLEKIWNDNFVLYESEREWLNDLQVSRTGEPIGNTARRMRVAALWGDRTAFDEHIHHAVEAANTWQRMADTNAGSETLLEQLEQLSAGGRAIRNRILNMIIHPQNYFAANLKLNALRPLSWASIKLTDVFLPPQEMLYINRLTELGLTQVLFSHIEVRSSTDYSLDEQRNVYETAINVYRRYENTLRALKTLSSDRLLPASTRLLEGLQYARALAEGELESVVRKQEQLEVELPVSKTLRPKAPTKHVFKARRKLYLVGDRLPANTQRPRERMTINDPLTGNTIVTFDQHENNWVDTSLVEEQAPALDVVARSLAQIRESGQLLIDQRKGIEQQVTAEQRLVNVEATREDVDPDAWDKTLTAHARKFTALADELVRDHSDKPVAQDLLDAYRADARDMMRLAQRECSRAYKQQLPTSESLAYLWDHGEIDINLTSTADPNRPTLSGDFFTEYAVYDKATKPPVVLWYAHFHYADAGDPPTRYTRAHLKLAEQRKFTQKDLLKAHVQDYLSNLKAPGSVPVKKIIYVLITPPVDQLFLKIAP